jgi:hypothetical protein
MVLNVEARLTSLSWGAESHHVSLPLTNLVLRGLVWASYVFHAFCPRMHNRTAELLS